MKIPQKAKERALERFDIEGIIEDVFDCMSWEENEDFLWSLAQDPSGVFSEEDGKLMYEVTLMGAGASKPGHVFDLSEFNNPIDWEEYIGFSQFWRGGGGALYYKKMAIAMRGFANQLLRSVAECEREMGIGVCPFTLWTAKHLQDRKDETPSDYNPEWILDSKYAK